MYIATLAEGFNSFLTASSTCFMLPGFNVSTNSAPWGGMIRLMIGDQCMIAKACSLYKQSINIIWSLAWYNISSVTVSLSVFYQKDAQLIFGVTRKIYFHPIGSHFRCRNTRRLSSLRLRRNIDLWLRSRSAHGAGSDIEQSMPKFWYPVTWITIRKLTSVDFRGTALSFHNRTELYTECCASAEFSGYCHRPYFYGKLYTKSGAVDIHINLESLVTMLPSWYRNIVRT